MRIPGFLTAAAVAALAVLASGLQAQTASPSVGCAPFEVDFTPPDNGQAFWDFGDNVTSTLPSPSHVYTSPGVYTVTFRRGVGGPVVGTTTVRAYPAPTLQLTVDTMRGCVPHPVEFSVDATLDPGVAIQGYTWAFGDGGTGTGRTPGHTYVSPGTFDVTVRLETALSSCNVTEIFEDAVIANAAPVAAFATDPSPPQSCDAPLTVRITDQSTGTAPLSYSWDFGNGRTSNSQSPGSVVYAAAGSYRITLRVTDANGCVGQATAGVSVGGPDPDFDLPDTVCINVPYTFRARGAADTFRFGYGPGIIIDESNGATQSVRFQRAGPTTVSLAVTNAVGGCMADTTRTIFVQEVFVDAFAEPAYTCERLTDVRFRVRSPEGIANWAVSADRSIAPFTSRDTTVEIFFSDDGEYGYNWYEFVEALVVVTTPQGCRGDTVIAVATDVPNALFIPDVHYGCAPLTVTFADSVRSTLPVTSYRIEWGDGTEDTFTAGGPWRHTYTTPGEYTAFVSIVNEAGCTDRSYGIEIQVGAPVGSLDFSFSGGDACPGDTLTFVNLTDDPRIDNVKFRVEGGNDFHCGSDDALELVVTRPITGSSIEATLFVEYNGCIDSLTRQLPYTPAPLAELGYRIDCDAPFVVNFFDRATGSTRDSIFIQGITDTAFRQNLLAVTGDSLAVTLPARGAYRAILLARGSNAICGPNRDTVEFYITVPEARFTIPELFCAGLPLPLDGSASQDVNASCHKGYQWDFSWDRPYVTSDPTLDEGEITADGRGPQTVSLIVEDINDCVDTLIQPIRLFVNNPTIAASRQRICLPATVSFTSTVDSDTTVVDYSWDFGGLGTSTDRNPTFTFPETMVDSGVIVVTLTTQDELGCPGMTTFELEIYRPVSNVITQPSPPFICVGNSVRFEATDFTAEGSNLRFNWDFGNGQRSQNRIEEIVYANEGTYDVRLDYVEVGSGCAADTTFQVVVEAPPVPAFTSDFDGQPVICYPEIITFTDASVSNVPTSAIWFVNGVIGSGPTFTATLGLGTNVVILTSVTDRAGCNATTSRTFELVGPQGDFDFAPQTICVGQTVEFTLRDTADLASWTWDFGNGVTEDNTNPATATYDSRPPSGFTVVSLTLQSRSSECTFTTVDTLRFLDVVADFTTETERDVACSPVVQLVDRSMGASSYLYTFPDGTTSTERNPRITFPGPGDYAVRLVVSTPGGLCSSEVTKTITVLPDLGVAVEVLPACPGEGAEIRVTGARDTFDVAFTPADLIAAVDGNVFRTVPITGPERVTVTVTDTFGCNQTFPDLVVGLAPTYTGSGDTFVIFAGTPVTLTVADAAGFSLRWADPSAVGCTDCTMPTVRPEQSTDYAVTVSDPAGCGSRTIVFRVIVAVEPIIPNLFTPNGDGTNDNWGPLFPEGLLPGVEVYQVFSRWGSLVFDSDNPTERWMGDNRGGGDAPSDVYTYVVRLVYDNGTTFERSGEVTLLR